MDETVDMFITKLRRKAVVVGMDEQTTFRGAEWPTSVDSGIRYRTRAKLSGRCDRICENRGINEKPSLVNSDATMILQSI